MRRLLLLCVLTVFSFQFLNAQSNCASAQPFCTGTTYNFPASTNTTAQAGPNYGCLFSQPNPAWYYLQISTSGNLIISIAGQQGGSSGQDVDFICWGPFGSLTNVCNNLTSGNTVDCSYSASSTETCTINNAIVGQFYMLCVTNYANVNQNIVFSQSGGTGATNCNILCNITNMTRTVSACSGATNTYSVTGSLNVFAPPSSGNLTISSSCGGSTVIPAPFASTVIPYTLPNLNATGANCSLTASFSADPTCTFVVAYTAPASCSCAVSLVTNSPTICQGAITTLTVSGATSYTWNPGALTTTAITVSPASTTVYTVTGKTGTCTATKQVTVTVNPLPTVTPGSNSPLCTGNTLSLTVGAASTYTWAGPNSFSSNAQNPTISNVTSAAAGNYTVKVTSAAGCTNSAVVNVSVTTSPTLTVNSPTICQGSSATLNVSGATSYTWNPGGSTGASLVVSPASTTIYTVTGSNGGACVATKTTNVVVNPLPVVSPGSNSPLCSGGNLNLTVGAASTYTWTGPNSFSSNLQNPTITNVTTAASGNYTVALTSAAGCTSSAVVNVSVTTSPVLTVNSPTICQGSSATLNVSGAASFTWNPGGSTGTSLSVSPASTTIYTVTGSNGGTCVASKTTNVVVNPLPTVTPGSNSPLCAGNTLSLTVGAASTYTWTGPNVFSSNAQNPTIAGVTTAATGNYTVAVTSAAGCTNSAVVSVSVTAQPVAVAGNNGPLCAGKTLTLTGSGGGTYSWTGPSAFSSTAQNPTIAGTATTASGVYSLVVSIGSCTSLATTSVTINPTPTVTASSNTPLCAGSTLSLTSAGGGTYSWSGPSAFSSTSQNPTISNAATANSGSYTVTVTSAAGCTNTAVTSVTVNAVPNPVVGSNSPICANTTLSLTASGGTSYSWTGPNSFSSVLQNPTISNASAANIGVYTVNVTSSGCSKTGTVSVNVLTPTTTASNTGPYCAGQTISLSTPAATSYTWTGPAGFTSSLQNPTIASSTTLMTGTYSVLVAVGSCTSSAFTTVLVNALPTPTASNTGPYCPGNTIQLNGSPASTYTWSGPGFTSNAQSPSIPSASVSNGGTYTFSVTNAAGCTASTTTSVTVNPTPNPVVGSNSPVCLNSSINLTASGGTSYSWSGPNGFTSSTQNPSIAGATSVNSGVYTVTVTALGCTNTGTVNVNILTPTTTAGNTGPYCVGQTISLNTPSAASYTWSGPGGFTSNAQNPTIASATTLMSGTYSVLVTAGSCTAAATTSVTVNALPTPTASNTGPYCPGNTIQLNGSSAVTYTWSGPAFSSNSQNPTVASASVSNSGTYTLTVTNANGCQGSITTSVTVNPTPNPVVGSNSPVCLNSTINLTATGGTSYSWSGPNGFTSSTQNPSIAGATAVNSGVYTVTVTALGCTNTGTVNVNILTPTTTASNTGPYCAGQTISLTTPSAVSYTWSGPGGFTSNAQNPTIASATTLMSGTYSVLVTAGSCTAAATTPVIVNALPTPTASNTGPYCPGNTIQLNGAAAASYTWSGPSFSSNNQNPSVTSASVANSGNYTLTVTDANGCSASATTSVTVNPTPGPVVGSNSPVCVNYPINLTASGGTSYAWSGPNSFSSAQQNPSIASSTPADAGVYTVTVTALGCSNTGTVSVSVLTPTTSAFNTGPYCAGSSIQLNAPSASSYTWSGPGGFTSGAQNPVIPNCTTAMDGNYTVLVAIGSCTATASTSVTVNALPNPVANSNSPVCAGQTINFTGAGATTYTWTGPASYTSISQNPSISNAVSGNTGTYTLTVTDANSCVNSATVFVVVNPIPLITVNNPTVCATQAINLTAVGGASYAWTGPASYTSSAQNPSIPNASPLMSGSYTVLVSSSQNCTNTAVANVSVIQLPVPVINSNAPICAGNNLTLNGSGGGTYAWSGPNNFSSTNQNTGISNASVSASGIYTLTASAQGCSASTTASITINPLPVPVLNSNGPVCIGAGINFTGGGGTGYQWFGPGGFSSTSQNPTIGTSALNNAGTYTLIVTDANNCVNTAQLNVVVNPQPTALATGALVCQNGNTSLGANGGTSYSWTGPNGFTSTTQNPLLSNVQPQSAGQYTVLVTNANSCTNTAVATLTVNPAPTPNLQSNSPICMNQVLNLSATGGISYSWSGPNGFTSNSQNPSLTANTAAYSGNYIVTVTDANNCSASASISATVNALPTAAILSGNNKGCAPLCVTFSVQSSSQLATINWVLGDGSYSNNVNNPNRCYTTAGVYTISAAITDNNGCPATAVYTVEAYPQPVADFNHSPIKPIVNVDGEVTFTDASHGTPITSWNWYFMNTPQYQSAEQNPHFTYTDPGNYAVALIVKSDKGCMDTLIKVIEVGEDFGLYVPNAFTPNGDGLNDTFQPKGFGIVKYEMEIFDRWGEKIFESSELEQGWDGIRQKSHDVNYTVCKEDIYVWRIKLVSVFGKAHEFTGHVTLIK